MGEYGKGVDCRMKAILLVSFILSGPALAETVKDHPCKVPGSSTGIEMMQLMEDDMRIYIEAVDQSATKKELIANAKVTDRLASQFARQDYREEPNNWTSAADLKKIYSEDDARNLIIKFHYYNKDKKENIFLVSALANKYECGVRFNGYIVVKREF